MGTKKIFGLAYRQDYLEGYTIGLNPRLSINFEREKEAFIAGFNSARLDYERMNGLISAGIPTLILTNKHLESFLITGLVGLSIDTVGYTSHQISVIMSWYQSGIEQYDLKQNAILSEILENNGIEFN